jgi:hypothetical protein
MQFNAYKRIFKAKRLKTFYSGRKYKGHYFENLYVN